MVSKACFAQCWRQLFPLRRQQVGQSEHQVIVDVGVDPQQHLLQDGCVVVQRLVVGQSPDCRRGSGVCVIFI